MSSSDLVMVTWTVDLWELMELFSMNHFPVFGVKKFALTAIVCAGLFGCGGDTQPTATESTPATPSQPSDTPVVKVVTSGVLPPLSFLNEEGNLQGIDIDVIQAIGKDQGFNVEIHKETFVNMLPSLESGKYQAVISGLSMSAERASKYGHTDTYLQNPPIVMYRADKTVTSIDSLKNLRVATMKDTIQEKMVNDIKPTSHDTVATVFQLYQGLAQGKYDAVLQDRYFLEYLSSGHPEVPVKTLTYDTGSTDAQIVIYTQKGDQALIDKLNKGIANLKQSGEIDNIIKKYIPDHTN